jgi:undecaprenyl-diphosphatase
MNFHVEYFLQKERAWCLRANIWADRNFVRQYFQTVSRLGDGIAWYLLGLAIFMVEGAASLPALAHLLCVAIVVGLMYRSLKKWTKRPRPFKQDPRIHLWSAPLDEYSFPSGHTLHAVSLSLVTIIQYLQSY